jgi:hypothetical protein
MSSEKSQPPGLAIWLLRHLCSNQDQEALAGDLLERFAEGESQGWFWRQVLWAILVGASRECRIHWIQIAFPIIGAPALWFWGGRSVGAVLGNPIGGRAWDWGLTLQWPMSAVYDYFFRSLIVALMIQPLLAVLLLLDHAFEWVRLLRTLVISIPLIAATALAWTLWPFSEAAVSRFFVPMILFMLLISAWLGCRTNGGSSISGDALLLAARAVITGFVFMYLLHVVSAVGNGSWGALDRFNRPLTYLHGDWHIWIPWLVRAETFVVSATCGWIAGRLNRKYQRTMFATLALSWIVVFGYTTISYWSKILSDSVEHAWFRPYLADHIATFLAAIGGTVLGGWVSVHYPGERHSVSDTVNRPIRPTPAS